MNSPDAPLPLDAEAIAALDLDGVQLIEASAGTGKTHTIADLYLRQVLGGRAPAQILLVTFTNAATEELRGRIRARLTRAARVLGGAPAKAGDLVSLLMRRAEGDEDSRQWRDRVEFALAAMDEAAISTIHGYCQRALQQYALSSGQFFECELVADDAEFREAAVKDWWRLTTYPLDPAGWALVREGLPSLAALQKNLLGLRDKPSAPTLPEACPAPRDLLAEASRRVADLHALGPAWRAARDELGAILADSKALSRAARLPYHRDNLPGLLQAADDFFAAAVPPAAPFDDFEFLGSAALQRHSKPSLRGTDERLDHPLFVSIARCAAAWARFRERLRTALLIDAHRFCATRVAQAKREAAVLSYQDQLQSLAAALDSADGAELAARLRRQHPVAMIDEFQDTDAIQLHIFRRIYLGAEPAGLTLIGDPKQAIYSFRGGDIFTYVGARETPGMTRYQLDTNWRSRPGLVAAVNALFGRREAPFVFDRAIGFHPVRANPANAGLALTVDGERSAPLTLWRLPPGEDGKPHGRERMRGLINAAIAAEMLTLLGGDSRIEGRPLAHGDIAVLVRSAAEGEALGRELRGHGIPSVTVSRESVFASDEAGGLLTLLRGINQYQDGDAARRALASSLLGYDYREIAAIVDDERGWQRWVEDLADLERCWTRQGFVVMFERMLRRFDIAGRLAGAAPCERRLTNLLHLADLLQQQATALAGPDPLLGWFAQHVDAAAHEASELRLEGDESLVKIVTIHKAKGLQYPVVFVPFLWSCRQVGSSDATVFFHRPDGSACIDFGSDAIEEHRRLAEKERLAEDLRLLYVALTRAHSRVYLAWGCAGAPGNPGSASRTALAWLLHSAQRPADLDTDPVDGFPAAMDFDADLAALAAAADGNIVIEPLPEGPSGAARAVPVTTREPMALARFARARPAPWKIASFTGLTRGLHPAGAPRAGVGDDPILDFPAGSHVGLMMHSLLEHLDFAGDVDAQCAALLPRFLPGAGLDSAVHGAAVAGWLREILQAPLDDTGFSLAALAAGRRLNELEFDFALDRFDPRALNDLLCARAGQRLTPLHEGAFEGLINGVIDLVFEHRGRYYLADYKSNRLGPAIDDYARARLGQAMLDGRYDLQSLLYALALHRYLGTRLADYDYERHFGGSFYLFLRGLRAALGPSHGVHFERPDAATIAALERIFRYTPGETGT